MIRCKAESPSLMSPSPVTQSEMIYGSTNSEITMEDQTWFFTWALGRKAGRKPTHDKKMVFNTIVIWRQQQIVMEPSGFLFRWKRMVEKCVAPFLWLATFQQYIEQLWTRSSIRIRKGWVFSDCFLENGTASFKLEWFVEVPVDSLLCGVFVVSICGPQICWQPYTSVNSRVLCQGNGCFLFVTWPFPWKQNSILLHCWQSFKATQNLRDRVPQLMAVFKLFRFKQAPSLCNSNSLSTQSMRICSR